LAIHPTASIMGEADLGRELGSRQAKPVLRILDRIDPLAKFATP